MDNTELERLKEALSHRDIKLPSDDTEPDTRLSTADLSDFSFSSQWPSVTLNSTSSYSSYTIPTLSSSVFNGGNIITTNNTNPVWTGMPYSNGSGSTGGQLELEGEGADVLINGRSLKEFMEKMESRLAILVPDPAKLEHFEALKRAYDHYKTLEALCEIPKPEENNQ
jgi:hypothetical protein